MRLRPRTIAAPVLLGLLAAALLAGCGDGEPTRVTLASLADDPSDYHGRTVRIEGIVRGFDDPEHYVIEDAVANRVQLLPNDEAEPHVDTEIAVIGRFTFSDTEGRRLDIEEIE